VATSNLARPGAGLPLLGLVPAGRVARDGRGPFSMTVIYKICPEPLWQKAEAEGALRGLPIDHADGYIHFSTATQLAETLRLHFHGVGGLVVAAVDADQLGERLRYEPSRGGDLFPHLFDVLPMSAVLWVEPLLLGKDGHHILPPRVT
jgi:uncharacterized protein (DUF952 family)